MDAVLKFLSDHWVYTVGAVVAAIAGGLTIKFISHKQSGSSSRVDQRNAQAGGDIVGRDKISR
jgi:hypothetical protein